MKSINIILTSYSFSTGKISTFFLIVVTKVLLFYTKFCFICVYFVSFIFLTMFILRLNVDSNTVYSLVRKFKLILLCIYHVCLLVFFKLLKLVLKLVLLYINLFFFLTLLVFYFNFYYLKKMFVWLMS